MNKDVREFERMLSSEGLRLAALTRTGKGHYKAVVEAANGRKMTYVLASSGSDVRANKNRASDIKRFFNN